MKTLVILLCLGNNDKKNNLYMFNTDTIFFPNIFYSWLVKSKDAKPMVWKSGWYLQQSTALQSNEMLAHVPISIKLKNIM